MCIYFLLLKFNLCLKKFSDTIREIYSKLKNMTNKVLSLAQRKAQVLLLNLEFRYCRDTIIFWFFSHHLTSLYQWKTMWPNASKWNLWYSLVYQSPEMMLPCQKIKTYILKRLQFSVSGSFSMPGAELNIVSPSGRCSTIIDAAFGSLKSANHPRNYSDNTNCVWLIRTRSRKVIMS